MSKQCSLYPLVNGEPSLLYKKLMELTKNRPITNLIYAAYLQQGVAAQMDSMGKKRDKLDEHSAKDVYEFFEVAKMINEGSDVYKAEQRIGAKDSMGNLIAYADAKQALDIVQQFNETSKGLVASVLQQGDVFNILVERKDSRTQIRVAQVQEQQKLWQTIEQAFNNVGIDINQVGNNDLTREIVNPVRGKDFVNYLNSMKLTRNGLLSKRDIAILLLANDSDARVQRLYSKFGSLDDTAQKIYDSYRNSGTVTAGEMSLINATLDECKRFKGLNIANLNNQLQQESQNFKASSLEESIHTTLKTLDTKFGIDANEIYLAGKEIESLSQAAANAAVTIQRQLRELEHKEGVTAKGKQLETTLKQLMAELKSQHYYAGCLNFLVEANNQISYIESLLTNIPTTGTTMEIAAAKSRALLEIQSIRDAYYDIVKALSDIDSIVTDENITPTDKKTLQDKATIIKKFFDNEEKKLRELRKSTMLDISTEILGDTLPNGVAISNIVNMSEEDSSIFDYLYSVGRANNPLIGAMGKVIRDAQDSRDEALNKISLRIRRANDSLRKAGHNSSFMYGEDGYIISDIDWESYNKARKAEYNRQRKSGLKGLALTEAVRNWEDANTEDRVVDFTNGRTEKIPSSSYRKPFPDLTDVQQKYYDEMMQIKGEMGSLLPNYAQKQYLPPQMRRSFLDALTDAKSAKDVARAIWNKMGDIWKVREDDTEFESNGIINGDEYGIRQGSLDNTPLRHMPIFYVRRIKDQKELMKDFSGAMQAFSSTAINYDAMSQVKEIVEFMGDFIKGQIQHSTRNGVKEADLVVENGIRVFKALTKWASNTNTAAIIDGFISQHLYGVTLREKDQNKWTKFLKSILAYTSIKGLAVNVKGAISNYLVGEMQMLIEAGAGEFYGLEDYIWAHGKLFGDATVRAPGKIMDFFTNNENSYDVLLANLFDPIPGSFDKKSHKRYHNSMFRQLLSSDFTFLGYATGEHMIHYVGMYAILHKEKVLVNGKKTPLYYAFEKTAKERGNSYLVLKSGVTDLEGNPLPSNYIDTIRKRIRYANQSTHGSMNNEDKGLIHQRMWGKFVMNFRQWMVEYYSRRYRKEHFDASLNDWREGYWITTGKLVRGYLQDLGMFKAKAALHWNEMNDVQKANVRRCLAEHALLGSLTILSFALGEPEDHKKEFWYRMWIYQTKRAKLDMEAATPVGAIINAKTMLNSPIAATNTFNSLAYPIFGLGDIDDTIKSGPYKGWNKYGRNVLKYTVPFYNQIDQLKRMDEDESVFAIFDSSNTYR